MTKTIQRLKSLILAITLVAFAGDPLARAALAQAQAAKGQPGAADASDPYFRGIYRNFYDTYKLGPDDEIAIRVQGQPDYSIERVKVSPVGRVYHPLAGDIDVVGLTVARLTEKLTADFSQYIINPKVSVSLLEAQSAKIGVLGEVNGPGIVIMDRPMTVLDAISVSGGFSEYGSKSNVTVLRQVGDGHRRTIKVNVKRILEGKANGEENIAVQAGDTIIVHGNKKKTIEFLTSLTGFGYFLSYLRPRRSSQR